MANKIPLASSELGTLWMAYLKNRMMSKAMDYFMIQTDDEDAKKIMTDYYNNINNLAGEIERIFTSEGAVIPTAFQDSDVRKDAPPLFDNMFGIIFLRSMMRVSIGFHSLHLGMVYRDDILDFQTHSYENSQNAFIASTKYLKEKGVLPRTPYVSMPKEVEFVENKDYTKGIRFFGNKRALNTIELAHIYLTIESNIFGTQLMTGFAQVAKESEVRDYFIMGKELAKKVVSNLTETLQQSDIQPPSTWIGRATDSTIPPFSDKIMMYITSYLSSYALGSNAFGASFSLRSDLPLKLATSMKDVYQFASKGGEIMIRHKWLEEPPQMEDRNQLTKSKQ